MRHLTDPENGIHGGTGSAFTGWLPGLREHRDHGIPAGEQWIPSALRLEGGRG